MQRTLRFILGSAAGAAAFAATHSLVLKAYCLTGTYNVCVHGRTELFRVLGYWAVASMLLHAVAAPIWGFAVRSGSTPSWAVIPFYGGMSVACLHAWLAVTSPTTAATVNFFDVAMFVAGTGFGIAWYQIWVRARRR